MTLVGVANWIGVDVTTHVDAKFLLTDIILSDTAASSAILSVDIAAKICCVVGAGRKEKIWGGFCRYPLD